MNSISGAVEARFVLSIIIVLFYGFIEGKLRRILRS